MRQEIYDNYLNILKTELVPALGCTEPIAIAYCAAKVQKLLACPPERITAVLSGNILKNVKSVVVPNTGGRKGIRPAIAALRIGGVKYEYGKNSFPIGYLRMPSPPILLFSPL